MFRIGGEAALNCNRATEHAIRLLLNPFQQNYRAHEGDQDADCKHDEILRVILRRRAIQIHEPKGAAEMCQREQFRNVADDSRELGQRRESAGEHKDRQEKENGELDRLRLRA